MRRILGRPGTILLSGLLLCTTGLLAMMGGCGGTSNSTPPPPPPPAAKIQHVVIIFQENRTPDNLFQDIKLINNTNSSNGKGADIQNYGINSKGNKIMLTPTTLSTDYDLGHGHTPFLEVYD